MNYNDPMNWPPHITVATIVQKADKFLMVEEQDASQIVINQPAGHLEPHETIFEAACRETLEETGWIVELKHIVGIYHFLSPVDGITYHRICFAAEAVSETESELDPDIISTHWLTLSEIETAQKRSPLVLRSIEDYLKGNPVPLSFLKHIDSEG